MFSHSLAVPSEEFDEGVYLGSAQALSAGAELGRDVFSSQPPLFYAALRWGHALVGGDPASMRFLSALVAMVGCLAAFALVRTVAGPFGGLAAAVFVGMAFANNGAGIVTADAPSVALGVSGLAAGAAGRRPIWGLAAGALTAAAVLVKLLALPFIVALAAVVWRSDQRGLLIRLTVAGAGLVIGATLIAYADNLAAIYDGAVGLHFRSRGDLPDTFRDAVLYRPVVLTCVGLTTALAVGLYFNRPRAWRPWLGDRIGLLVLLPVAVVLVAFQRPLFSAHLVVVTVPLALLAGSAWSRARPAALVAVAAIAFVVAATVGRPHFGRHVLSGPELTAQRRAASIIRGSTVKSDSVVSDLPLVPLFADRPGAHATLDPSKVRVEAGSLERSDVLRAAEGAGAVVVGRAFTQFPGLGADLRRRMPRMTRVGGSIDVYLRKPPLERAK